MDRRFSESAWARGKWDFVAGLTGSPLMWGWVTLCGLAGAAAGTWLSFGHSRGAATAIVFVTAAAGIVIAVGLGLGVSSATAPLRQRDESRNEIARLTRSSSVTPAQGSEEEAERAGAVAACEARQRPS